MIGRFDNIVKKSIRHAGKSTTLTFNDSNNHEK